MKRGFTLIELLVVLGIIAILAALLLPVLSRTKQRSKRVLCLNNLRQFLVADNLYLNDHQELPPVNAFVPSSITRDRLAIIAEYLGVTIPAGPVTTWPKRMAQPKWINCPMAAESGIAEGLTVGGGVYTGYAYFGGIEESTMVAKGFATMVNPGQAADRLNNRRGVVWTDILDEFLISEPRRYEFFHCKQRVRYPDFRFHAAELEGIHRGWSDGSVEWVPGNHLNLSGPGSPDLRIKHLFGSYYF